MYRAALGHAPAVAAGPVERNIDADVIIGIAPACPVVIGREHRADKGDDRQPVSAAIAQAVDIPPEITAGRDVRIEARSSARLSAASMPESVAIGTPGPGWALPPAR
jgi:hypothetical protein